MDGLETWEYYEHILTKNYAAVQSFFSADATFCSRLPRLVALLYAVPGSRRTD